MVVKAALDSDRVLPLDSSASALASALPQVSLAQTAGAQSCSSRTALSQEVRWLELGAFF